MRNNKKEDKLTVNIIAENNDVKHASHKTVGTADKEPFCVYDHKRHAVGSTIKNPDGPDSICKEDGWK